MAFVVEDGTGLANATSYCDIAFADSYFADRGNITWENADEADAKMPALIKATDYIERRFGYRWIGTQEFPSTQALGWPRKSIPASQPFRYGFVTYVPDPTFPTDQVPVNLKKACAEYALRLLAAKTLAPDPVTDETGRLVHQVMEKVGPIETNTVYDTSGPGSQVNPFPPYPMADALLRPLLQQSSGLVRA